MTAPWWGRGEIAVLGLGRSGSSASKLLRSEGARVYASDIATDDDVAAAAAELREIGVVAEVGAHDLERISRATLVVVSPGIPPNAPPLAAARAAGVTVISEVELALRYLGDTRVIAVTGTNGKTTTTALTGHLLRSMGYVALDAGNIGTPLCDIVRLDPPPAWVALEMSSFQLHDTPSLKPAVGVLTNLSPDHLDRYSSVSEYFADKALLFRNAAADGNWVVNLDDDAASAMTENVGGAVHRFSLLRVDADAWFNRATGELMVRGRVMLDRSKLSLLGDHNVANALAAALAVTVADPLHESTEMHTRIADALSTFRALPHRLEPVGEFNGVMWINDSKATNVSSTLVAIRSMPRPAILLLGGKHKGEAYTSLAADIARGCKLVIAYGAAADIIEQDLSGVVPIRKLGSSFEEVVRCARAAAAPGDVVLLSPACSSFDMFNNYGERGDLFRALAAGEGS